MNLSKLVFALGVLSAAHAVSADDQSRKPYLGKLVPELTQCRTIDGNHLMSGSDGYVLAECDSKDTKTRSLRIWRTRADPASSDRFSQTKIYGEIILPWKPIKWSDYSLALCKEKGKEEFEAGVYIRMGSAGPLDANEENALAFFAERANGRIQRIPFSKIDTCDY